MAAASAYADPLLAGTWSGADGGGSQALSQIEDYQLHAQSTWVEQAHPSFASPYRGQNSLRPETEIRETVTATLFAGIRLGDDTALYFDPEMSQGLALSDGVGVAGFPNGEGTHAGAKTPKFYAARYFLRHVIAFVGETEAVADDENQLAGTVDTSRLTVTLGKFAPGDIFDDNDYAHDPRHDFLNWSVWESSAWDFPADARGYTYGLAVELNQPGWALRGGWMLEPKIPNEKALDSNFLHYHGAVVELEVDDTLAGHDGKLRLLTFANTSEAGSYAASLRLMPVGPDIAQTRIQRTKYGFAVNWQQEVAADVGVFARLSWNDGRTESYAFTEIDNSATAGVSVKGEAWGRADDIAAVAVATNGISTAHRAYLAAGGYGFIIGDGRLNYGREQVVETYYAAKLSDPLTLTLDYQHIGNPAYNRDRGPVSVFALKAHLQF